MITWRRACVAVVGVAVAGLGAVVLVAALGGGGSSGPKVTVPVSSATALSTAPATPFPTPVPQSSPAPVVLKPLYAYATPPPIADSAIKLLVGALTANDAGALKELISLTALPCVVPSGGIPSAPPCPAEVASGTSVEAFPSGSCESSFIDTAGLDDFVQRVSAKKQFVFAAFVQSASAGGTTVVMEDGVTHLANSYTLRGGRLVQAHFGCGTDQTPPNALNGVDASSIVIAPPP